MNSLLKKLSLLIATTTLVACSNGKSEITSSTNSANSTPVSSPDSSYDSEPISVPLGSSINPSSSNYSPIFTLTVGKELRNPSGLSHKFSYDDLNIESYKAFKDKINAFSYKVSEYFTKRNYESGKNIVVSPLSIELCLGLAVRSSNGITREELLTALDIDYQTFNTYYKLLFNEMTMLIKSNMGDLVGEQILTNSIWINKDTYLYGSGLDALRDDYYCYAYETDFANHNAEANKEIADFIVDNTKGLINPEMKLSHHTLFVLMNTIYLRDVWNKAGFELPFNNNYIFTNSDGSKSNKPLLQGDYIMGKILNQNDYSSFFTGTQCGFKLHFIKPNEGKTAKDVLNKETLDYVLDSDNYITHDDVKCEEYNTRCIFPEYSAKIDIDLGKMFQEDFNVKTLFNSAECDFSNLTNQELYVEEFRHIARLDVDKIGIKGAAVTYMAEAGAAGPGPYTQINEDFVLDQEFAFVLTKNNVVVFSGVVTNIDK